MTYPNVARDTIFGVADDIYPESKLITDQQQNVTEISMPELLDIVGEERKINLGIIWNAGRLAEWYSPFKRVIPDDSLRIIDIPAPFPGGDKWLNTCKTKYGKQLDRFMDSEFAAVCHQNRTEQFKGTAEVVLAENVIGRTIPATQYDIDKFNLKEISLETAEKKLDQERSNGVVTMPDGRMYTKEFFDIWEKRAWHKVQELEVKKPLNKLRYVNLWVGYVIAASMNWAINDYVREKSYRFDTSCEEPLRKHLRIKRVEKELKKLYNWDEKDQLVYIIDDSGKVERTPVRDKNNCSNEYLKAREILQIMIEDIVENEYANESRLSYRVYPSILTAQLNDEAQSSDSLSAEER